MRQYGRIKKVTGGKPYKIDRHPHPKRIYCNWWELICDPLPRTTIKAMWRREVDATLTYLE